MDSLDHIKIAAIKELQDAIKIKKTNDELQQYLIGAIQWIIRYSNKNNFRIPDKDKMIEILDRITQIKSHYPK